ncbi:MAG: oligosaccharide flippase family protein [Chloroflexota bacterium]
MTAIDTAPAQPLSRVSRSRLISSSVYSTASQVLSLPIALVVNSFVVHRIGLDNYGIWATLTMILGYGSLLSLGINESLVKYVAEYMASGRRHEINALVSTSMVVYSVIGMAFVAVMALAANWILIHEFHAQPGNTELYEFYLAVVVGCAVSLALSVLNALVIGLQRADLVAKALLAYNLINAVASVIAVMAGLGFAGLALAWLISQFCGEIILWLIARHLFPELSLNPFLFRRSTLKQIARFSSKVQVTTLTLTLNDQVDRTLIGFALGPAMLGAYALASRAASALRKISFGVMSGVLAAGSDLSALDDATRLRRLYLRASRYIAIVDFGLMAATGGLAVPLVWAWLGDGFARTAVTLMIIVAGYAIWLPDQATSDLLYSINKPGIRMRADVAFLCIHLPISIVLIWRFGYFGTVVGTAVALSITRLYLYRAGSRALGVPSLELVRKSFLQPAVAALLALGAVAAVQISGIPLSLPALVGEIALFVAVYGGYIAAFALDRYDYDLLQSYLRPLVKRLLPA